MCLHVLPYLLQVAHKHSPSASLDDSLSRWAEESAAQVEDDLRVCRDLLPGNPSEEIKRAFK